MLSGTSASPPGGQASQAKEAQEKHERKRREKLRAENIQRRYEEDTTLH